jgi:limonene-1,2-epoxide hydrolase
MSGGSGPSRSPSGTPDWEAWARAFESIDGPDEFAALFAPDGLFCDPVTPWTNDLHKVARDTDAIFPDWAQRVDRIRGGERWAFFEWTGTGTFRSGGAEGEGPGRGIPITMQGATVIEVDGDGKVTSWRDYLDTNEPMQQIQAGLEGRN